MTANTSPIFPLTPHIGFANITSSNSAADGTGTVVTLFTAGANGSFISSIFVKPTTANSFQAVGPMRFWLNNGSTNTTATNNCLLFEITLPSTVTTATTCMIGYEIPFNKQLKANYKINVSGPNISNNWAVCAFGSDY